MRIVGWVSRNMGAAFVIAVIAYVVVFHRPLLNELGLGETVAPPALAEAPGAPPSVPAAKAEPAPVAEKTPVDTSGATGGDEGSTWARYWPAHTGRATPPVAAPVRVAAVGETSRYWPTGAYRAPQPAADAAEKGAEEGPSEGFWSRAWPAAPTARPAVTVPSRGADAVPVGETSRYWPTGSYRAPVPGKAEGPAESGPENGPESGNAVVAEAAPTPVSEPKGSFWDRAWPSAPAVRTAPPAKPVVLATAAPSGVWARYWPTGPFRAAKPGADEPAAESTEARRIVEAAPPTPVAPKPPVASAAPSTEPAPAAAPKAAAKRPAVPVPAAPVNEAAATPPAAERPPVAAAPAESVAAAPAQNLSAPPPVLPEFGPRRFPLPKDLFEGWLAARQAYAMGDYRRAEGLYERLIAAYPEEADLSGELGNLYLSTGRPSEAAVRYLEAAERMLAGPLPARAGQLLGIVTRLDAEKGEELRKKLGNRN